MHINTDTTKLSRKGTLFLILAAISFLVAAATWPSPLGKSILIAAFSALAFGFYFTPLLRSFTFTAWVIAGVSAAICFPSAFGQWGELKLPVLIVPVVAGLAANAILYGKRPRFNTTSGLLSFCAGVAALATFIALLPGDVFGKAAIVQGGVTLGMAMLSIVSGVKWMVRIACGGPENWMDKTLPLVSMFGIWFILIIITAPTFSELG